VLILERIGEATPATREELMALRTTRFSCAFLLALQLTGSSSAAQTEVKPLAGIKKISVVVENIDPDGVKAGITRERLQTITELKLRLGGIRVLSDEEDAKDPDINPFFYVVVLVLQLDNGRGFAVHVQADLRRFTRSPINGASTRLLLWESGTIAKTGSGMPKYAEGIVGDLVDEFLNEFLAANPKQP
jgi:hypothetical protein